MVKGIVSVSIDEKDLKKVVREAARQEAKEVLAHEIKGRKTIIDGTMDSVIRDEIKNQVREKLSGIDNKQLLHEFRLYLSQNFSKKEMREFGEKIIGDSVGDHLKAESKKAIVKLTETIK